MSLMMARNADSATKTTAQVLRRPGSLVVSRMGGNHRLSAKFLIRLHAELAAPREPNNRSGKVYRVGELDWGQFVLRSPISDRLEDQTTA